MVHPWRFESGDSGETVEAKEDRKRRFVEKLFVIRRLRRSLSNGERSFGPQGAAAQFFYLPWFSAWKWSDLIGCNETDQPPLPRVVKGAIRFAVSDPSTVTRKWSFHGLSGLGEREFHSFCAKEGEKISRSVYGLREGKGRGLGTIGLSVLNNCYLDGKLTKSARQLGLLTPLPPFLFLFHPLVRPLRKQPIRPVRALKT